MEQWEDRGSTLELKERVIRLMLESYEEEGSRRGAVALGINPEVLRKRVYQAEVDRA